VQHCIDVVANHIHSGCVAIAAGIERMLEIVCINLVMMCTEGCVCVCMSPRGDDLFYVSDDGNYGEWMK
jgi:hypothetical protein